MKNTGILIALALGGLYLFTRKSRGMAENSVPVDAGENPETVSQSLWYGDGGGIQIDPGFGGSTEYQQRMAEQWSKDHPFTPTDEERYSTIMPIVGSQVNPAWFA